MRARRIGLGRADLAWLLGVVVIAAAVTFFVSQGWEIAVVPGMTYLAATTAALAVYRIQERRRAELGLPASFRVIDGRGRCLRGYGVGEVFRVGADGKVFPSVCEHAETVLKQAAASGDDYDLTEWCCPVYEHLLVFQRAGEAV